MKKFLLFFLLLPLFNVQALGCDSPPCNPEDLTACASTWVSANNAFQAQSASTTVTIDGLNDQISELAKKYRKCVTDERQKILDQKELITREKELQIKDTCKFEDDYNKPVTDLEAAKAKARKALYDDTGKDFECADKAYNAALSIQLGKDTGSFDVSKHLRASDSSQEINLDIVDNVKGETNILNRVLKLLTQVLGTFAILMMVIGAYYMITSQGDESQLQKGKNIFFYTIIGLLIAFMSYIAVQFVISLIFTTTG
jgi:hypothetical protein